jgi:hypothetical protein
MNDEMIRTGVYTQSGDRRTYLDDPKQRQLDVKNMTPKQKERYAKFYIRMILKRKEEMLWFKRMTNPAIHQQHREIYNCYGGK